MSKQQKDLLSWLRIARAGGAKYETFPFSEVGYDHGSLNFVLDAGYTIKRDPATCMWTVYL